MALSTALGAAAVGAVALPAVGSIAGALVPTAMSAFGTVVAGVGTLHAPLAAGGVAAILQANSALLVTTKAAAIGAVAVPVVSSIAAGSLVPTAMTTFGTAVAGVGTLQATGGVTVATIFKAASAALVSTKAVALPMVGSITGSLVPTAMSTLGSAVAGVGTLQAAGGVTVSAIFQAASTALVNAKAAAIGAALAV